MKANIDKTKSVEDVLAEQHKHVHNDEECPTCKAVKEGTKILVDKNEVKKVKFCKNCNQYVQGHENYSIFDSGEEYCPECRNSL